MSRPFSAIYKDKACTLADFIRDISRWRGLPPRIIHLSFFNGFEDVLIGFFIWNDEDRTYYKVRRDGKKPNETLEDYVSLTDYGALNGTIVRGASFMLHLCKYEADSGYSAEKDIKKWARWIAKYSPNRFKQ